MNVTCPECQSIFRVDPTKVPATGVRARCSVCGGIISITGGSLPVSVTPPLGSAAHQPESRVAGSATPAVASRVYTPRLAPTPVTASPAVTRPAAPTPATVAATASFAPAPATPSAAAPTAPFVPAAATPSAAAPTAPFVPAAATPAAARVPMPHGRMSPPVSTGAVLSAESATSAKTGSSVSASTATGFATPGPTLTSTLAPTPAAARRQINPFLRADPVQRARRLARALVSDLVAYHPRKREEGLRDGTLRQLFREEIKKSYEEYVEQVGRDLAEGAPYFQEALNEILADGQHLF